MWKRAGKTEINERGQQFYTFGHRWREFSSFREVFSNVVFERAQVTMYTRHWGALRARCRGGWGGCSPGWWGGWWWWRRC